MKRQIEIEPFTGGVYTCQSYFNDDLDNGVEVKEGGKELNTYLGRIVGVELPDERDDEAVEEFTNLVENWLIDNGY